MVHAHYLCASVVNDLQFDGMRGAHGERISQAEN